jgi:hypothetical protein
MNKQDLVAYCYNLLGVIDSKEKTGGLDRGGALAREYLRAYDELVHIIRKEEDDEARQSKRPGLGSEDRTSVQGSEPRGSLPAGVSRRSPQGG